VAVARDQPVVAVVDAGAVVDVVADAPAVNVASKGTFNGVGSTTGTPFRVTTDPNAPMSRIMVPLAWMVWLSPVWIVPAHRVVPVAAEVAWIQHGCVDAVTLTW
jgi:hypothetical protein